MPSGPQLLTISGVFLRINGFLGPNDPIVANEYGRNRAYVNIEGRAFRIGLDYGREQDSIKSYLLKITTGENPQDKLKHYPAPVVAAIAQGRKPMNGFIAPMTILSTF